MYLILYNNRFEKAAIIDSWVSLIWTEEFNDELGGIDLQISATKENINLFKRGYFLCRSDKVNNRNTQIKQKINSIMIITTIQLKTNQNGQNELVIGGQDITTILKNRISHKTINTVGKEFNGYFGYLNEKVFADSDLPIYTPIESGIKDVKPFWDNRIYTWSIPERRLDDADLFFTDLTSSEIDNQKRNYSITYNTIHYNYGVGHAGDVILYQGNYYESISREDSQSLVIKLDEKPYYYSGQIYTGENLATYTFSRNRYILNVDKYGAVETDLKVRDVIISSDGVSYIVTKIQNVDSVVYNYLLPFQSEGGASIFYDTQYIHEFQYKNSINYDSFFDILENICVEYDVGIQLFSDGELQEVFHSLNPKFKICFYTGRDLSIHGTETPIIFSSDFENVITTSYTEDDTDEFNYILISGRYPTNPNDDGKEGKPLKEASYTTYLDTVKTGIEKKELHLDKSSESYRIKSQDGQKEGPIMTIDNYRDLLVNYGNEERKKHLLNYDWDAEIIPNSTYILNDDYYLGDIVSVKNNLGFINDARIISVSETWDSSGYNVDLKLKYIYNADKLGAIETQDVNILMTESEDNILL